MKKIRFLLSSSVVALLAIAALLAATASAGERSAGASETTVTFWDDIYTDAASIKAQKEMVRLFEKSHPGVKVNYVVKPFAQFVPTAKLQLSGKGAPDVVICASGETCNGDLVRGKLVIDTEQYSRQHGWLKNTPRSMTRGERFTDDGRFGAGKLYGFSETEDILGLYYNKQKLKKLGITRFPQSIAELERAMDRAKEAGELPLQLGDLAPQSLVFVWFMLMNHTNPPESLNNWVFHNRNVSIVTPGGLRAVNILKRWVDRGYFSPNLLGLDMVVAVQRFNDGEGVFLPTGAWWTGLMTKLKNNAGFGYMPGLSKGARLVATHGLSNPLMVTSKSENPELAMEFIEHMTGPKTAQVRANVGMNTTNGHAVKSVPTTTQKETLALMGRLKKRGYSVHFLDVTAPGMLSEADKALQKVVAGEMSPREFLQSVQDRRDKHIKKIYG